MDEHTPDAEPATPESRQMNQGHAPPAPVALATTDPYTPARPRGPGLDTGARGWRWLLQAH
jgi:hypothetical protein